MPKFAAVGLEIDPEREAAPVKSDSFPGTLQ